MNLYMKSLSETMTPLIRGMMSLDKKVLFLEKTLTAWWCYYEFLTFHTEDLNTRMIKYTTQNTQQNKGTLKKRPFPKKGRYLIKIFLLVKENVTFNEH